MQVILARGGGVAGLRKPPIELDTGTLPTEAAAALRTLVDRARVAARDPAVAVDDAPDQIGYSLTIIGDDRETQTIEVRWPTAPPDVRALITEIRRLASSRASGV